jgi:methionyl-tRNA formyltransferase
MRVGFVTAVRLGLSCMEAIYDVGGRLSIALTLRDDLARAKSGRVYLDSFCGAHGIPLHKIRNINDSESVDRIRAADLDWLFIIGWSQIAGEAVLQSARKGAIGIHPTLLPIGRGRAPIPWAILLGLATTGVTLFKLDRGVDTGPIIAQTILHLSARETATSLYERVDAAHLTILKENWAAVVSDSLVLRPQDEAQATTWRARRPEDGKMDAEMSVATADRLVRAVTRPYPGAFLEDNEGILRVWATGAPNEDLSSNQMKVSSRRLRFRDGWLDATDWAIEPARPMPTNSRR